MPADRQTRASMSETGSDHIGLEVPEGSLLSRRRSSSMGRGASPGTHLSVADLPPSPAISMNRRRAVNTLDHKTCALLHSKLKGFHLEDVA